MASFSLAVEALVVSNHCLTRGEYSYSIWGADEKGLPGRVVSSNGIAIETQSRLDNLPPCDLLFICAYRHAATYDNPILFRTLRQVSKSGTRIAAMSCGSFVLARAGLLTGKSCTLVDEYQSTFAELYPRIPIQQCVYTVNDNILTCAGGTATLDMLLYIIGMDYGKRLAIEVSEKFMQERIRSHNDMDITKRHLALRMKSPVLGAAVELMENNLEVPLSVGELASMIGTTPRNLELVFRRHEGVSPARYYLNIRLIQAQRLLEETPMGLAAIANATGFSSQSHFGQSFKARFGLTPSQRRGQGGDGPLPKI